MYKLFGLYTQVSCVRFSCLEEMFTPRNFFRTENFEGGSHGSKSGTNRAELPHHTNKGESNMQ